MIKERLDYYLVAASDVENLLSFSKSEKSDLSEDISEHNRAQEELTQFISLLQNQLKEEIKYIGEDTSCGKHLERFLFSKGGFLEIYLEKPLVLKGHFLHKRHADRFVSALKHALKVVIPESPIKSLFIQSIGVEKVQKDPLSTESWMAMHKIYLKRSVIFTLMALFVVVFFELIKALAETVFLNWFGLGSVEWIVIVGAVVVAFLFEPMKRRTDRVVSKFFS